MATVGSASASGVGAALEGGAAARALTRIARVAARLVDADLAAVTLDDGEQPLASWEAGGAADRGLDGTAEQLALHRFARRAAASGAPLVVAGPPVAFAGVPLPELAAPVAGALCVARRRPWDAGDAERLAAQLPELAAIAAEELRHHLDAAPPGRGAEAGAADEATHRWVLRTSPDVLSFMSADLRYTWVHPGRTGLRAEDVIGRTDFDLFPREVAERLTALKREVLATGKGTSVEVPVTWDGAQHLWHCVLEPRRDGRGRLVGIAGYSRDVTEAREWERRHRAQLTVGSILAEGGDAAEALRGVLETVATAFGWELAEFWRLDADAGVLRFGSAWHDPAYELGEFVERSRELTFARGVGLPGRVWERGEPVWVDDVSRDECFVRRVIPQSEVLHTAYGLPVRTADRVAGVMMFLDSTVRHPEPDLSLMAHAGLQVGQFLERAAAEEAVRQRDLRLRILLDQVPAVLWSTDAGLRFTSSRGAGLAALGLAEEQVVGMHLRDYFGMPDDAPLMQYQYRALAGESVRYETAWAGRHFMSYVEPLRASGGEIVGTVGMGFDITERVQAEALVREKERFIERVATAVPTILYVYDILENRNVFANAEVSAILGYTPEEVRAMGTDFFPRTMHPDDLARLPERNRRFERLAEGEFVETVYRMRHASGEWRWLCSRDMVFGRSADGRPKEILGTALDITEQKQVEARLRQALRVEAMLRRVSALFVSQEQVRLDAVLEELGGTLGADRAAIVHVREPDGRLEKTHTWRAPAAPVPDRRLHDIPVDRLPWLAAQLRAGDTVSCDDVDALPDAAGAERALFRARGARAFAVSPLHSPEGRLLGLVAAESVAGRRWTQEELHALQLTSEMVSGYLLRREAAEALRRREEYFRSLIENATDLVMVLHLGGAIRYVSPSVERVGGHRPEALVGRSCFELVHPEDADALRAAVRDALARPGEARRAELRLRHGDGSWRVHEAVGTRLPDGEHLVVNSRDITEHREAEAALERSRAQLLQSQKMEAVGRLAGGIAHDFNNVLTAINANVDLALMDVAGQDPAREALEEIRHAASRAADLTRQLLAFSRQQVLRLQSLDLDAVVADVERMLRRLISEDVELVTSPSRSRRRVRVDRSQIEQVLVNLVVNARDAMPHGGVIVLATHDVDLERGGPAHLTPDLPPGRYVALSVSDTGSGMDDATRARIFEPFFTTKEVGKGTGLGLATVYGIVRQSGGDVLVRSTPGRGTVFTVYLPEDAGD